MPISLVASQNSGQAVTSKALKYNALASVVSTNIYRDILSDAELFAMHNVERYRTLGAAPALLLFGIIMGELVSHSPTGIVGILWIVGGIKLFVDHFLFSRETTCG